MAQKQQQQQELIIPMHMRFVFGGLSTMMSTAIIQPIDLIKTRMQNVKDRGRNAVGMPGIGRMVVREEGILGLYNGLSAALLRQATYGTTRLGILKHNIEPTLLK